jgi:4-amino-4-deoxy-L-arabinose transferase-like glycosyltransferase
LQSVEGDASDDEDGHKRAGEYHDRYITGPYVILFLQHVITTAMSIRARVLWLTAICLLTAVRIASTHGEFSPTWDEPYHVNAGHEYLVDHTYSADLQHPPLARIAFAWPLRHARPTGEGWERMDQIYDAAGSYMKGVIVSRRGNLIFVVLAIIGVYLWAARLFGDVAGIAAAALFASLQPILAHGGLATTDMAGTAGFALAMPAMLAWLERPSWGRTIVLGLAIAFGLVAKFSFVLFFAVAAVTMMIDKRRFPLFRGFLAHLLALIVVWGVYFFDLRPMREIHPDAEKLAAEFLHWPGFARDLDLPAPRFFFGLLEVARHDRDGHAAYLLGQVSETGWWYFFPVALGVKTPLPFLALVLAGAALTIFRRGQWQVTAIALLMLGILMRSHINIGVRHALPIYVPLAVLAGAAIVFLWSRLSTRIIVAALSAWILVGSVLAHPDYLPWMNAIAGKHPERFLLDSNLDWGQDLLRLSRECRRLGIPFLRVNLYGTTNLRRIGLPPAIPMDPYVAHPGWHAISETRIVTAQLYDPWSYRWLTDNYSYRRIGKSIRLYFVR